VGSLLNGKQICQMFCSNQSCNCLYILNWYETGVQVQEAAAASEGFLHMPDAQLNMGILSLALEKPKEAVQV